MLGVRESIPRLDPCHRLTHDRKVYRQLVSKRKARSPNCKMIKTQLGTFSGRSLNQVINKYSALWISRTFSVAQLKLHVNLSN